MAADFTEEYKKLNVAQKQAADHLDGPLLVLAGPGTGKTTLLTARVANILRSTDTLAENILCLTFTDSAQKTMQNRLVESIGQDAYKAHIHTFHSFGTWAMRTYPEYFAQQLRTKPADDVTRYQIFLHIFERLDHHDPLAAMNDGDYLYLPDTKTRISHLKQAGVSPDGLENICKVDALWLEAFEKAIHTCLAGMATVSKKTIPLFEQLLQLLDDTPPSELGQQAAVELRLALEDAVDEGKLSTKPITAWKNKWLIKKHNGDYGAQYSKELAKLRSLAAIYRSYQQAMTQRALVDYDDMLLRLLEALDTQPDFLAEIRERFLYIMVDEYQDTNGVQDKILEQISDSPVHNNEPNIMIVGDDDQAIYGFQGAYSSNVLDFLKRWPKTTTITLTQNYRSTPEIVRFARSVIMQGTDRLEARYEYVNKELTTTNKPGPRVQLVEATTRSQARLYLASQIKQHIDSGVNPNQITVLSPQHRYLEELLPYLSDAGIDASYERRQDVLNEPHIAELCLLARVIVQIGNGEHSAANESLPKLLSLPWWDLSAKSLWLTSLAASKQRVTWLEIIEQGADKQLAAAASWLLLQSKEAPSLPLEQMLDRLIGGEDSAWSYRRYYFDATRPKQHYLELLTALITLRNHLRDYQGVETLTLADFVQYVELRKQANLPITNDHPVSSRPAAVNLMTVYKAKGQEFDIVYLLDGHHSVWGDPKDRNNLIKLAPHIAAVPSGNNPDERLRAFYVGLTRAAKQLSIITNSRDDKNNEVLPLGWLGNSAAADQLERPVVPAVSTKKSEHIAELEWRDYVLPKDDQTWRDILKDSMSNYSMSPTHLNAFLDVANGGPRAFLINQLLRFPHALAPSASFGNAMHSLMQWLHTQPAWPTLAAAKKYFVMQISSYHLGEIETAKQTTRGNRAIEHLYIHKSQLTPAGKTLLVERDFGSDSVVADGMRLRGKLDLMAIDDTAKHVTITDYKTGKPAFGWPSTGSKSYEALKLHKYRQQLLFYKLLIEHSRSYGGKLQVTSAHIVFLEPLADSDNLLSLTLTYEPEEIARLQKLMAAVWKKITTLELPDTSNYQPDVAGVKQFEDDLLQGKI